MIATLITDLFAGVAALYAELPAMFSALIGLFYGGTPAVFTELGIIVIILPVVGLVAWGGFALISGLVSRGAKALFRRGGKKA
jgi:hypothetical protein